MMLGIEYINDGAILLTDYSELGGDEELPLGQEFQEHLRCFNDNSKKTAKDQFQMAEKLVKQLM